ncbi:MAG: diguanylate cyclase [Myxococcota bacterium]
MPSEAGANVVPKSDLIQLFEQSQDLIALATGDGYLQWLNPAWTRVLGWSAQELTSKPYVDFVHPADLASTKSEAGAVLKEGHTTRFENRYRCKDGTYRWLSWNSTVRGEGIIFCIVRDVTLRHEQERERRVRMQMLELAETLSGVGNWRADLEQGTVFWSRVVFDIHGRELALGTPTLDRAIEAYHPEDRDAVRNHLERALHETGEFTFRLRIVRENDGAIRTVSSSGQVQYDDEGQPTEIVGVFQDITDIASAEHELRTVNTHLTQRMAELEARSAMTARMSELGDLLQSAVDVEECKEVLQVSLPQVFNGLSGTLYLRDPETGTQSKAVDWGPLEGDWRDADPSVCWAVRRGATHVVDAAGVLRCRHLSGVSLGTRCVPMMAQGQLVGLLVLAAGTQAQEDALATVGDFSSNVADQIALGIANVRLRERLRHQSLRDQLTGLHNRRFFDGWMAKQLSQVRRSAGTLGIAVIDIDHFKRFNDSHGHIAADRMLIGFARLLEQSLRAEDVVCRWGGEEFVVAMPGAESEAVKGVIQRIQAALSQLEVLGDNGIPVPPPTVSAGVASFPWSASQQNQLLFCADQALFRAKEAGRNCVIVAEPKAESKSPEDAKPRRRDLPGSANRGSPGGEAIAG